MPMHSGSGGTVSLWMEDLGPDARSRNVALERDATADVCVVGAGIAGLSAARTLAREGMQVIVLEARQIASGESERTTAHLASAIDDRFMEMERFHGEKGSRLAAQSHAAAIDRIETIVNEEGIDCEFTRLDGVLFVPPRKATAILDEELGAARRAGLADVRREEHVMFGAFDLGPALLFPSQGQFHPAKYYAGLARAITKHGGKIYEHTHVTEVEGGENAHVKTARGHTVRANHIVVATNAPINDRFPIYSKQSPYRTYVIALRIPKESVRRALYWDTQDPYHYVRLQGEDILIVGGEDHRTGHADDGMRRFAFLEEWARSRLPEAGEILYRWSGQVQETADGLGMIGRNPMDEDNVYIVTGDSGMGMTHGTIAGMLIPDLIADRENPWADLYNPGRFRLRSTGELVKESAVTAADFIGDRVRGGEVAREADIPRGQGAVLRSGTSKVAVFRAEDGTLHRRSATCTHKGCIVRWNSLEKSWDCPCHGSRFAPDGTILTGPANHPLENVAEKADVSLVAPHATS